MKGFHLIEILICLTLITITTQYGLQIYTHHYALNERTVAKVALFELATKLEQFHLRHHTYNNATLKSVMMNEYTSHHSYKLQIDIANAELYVIKAIPENKQARMDVNCGTLILTSLGIKDRSGTAPIASCWG